MPIVYRIDAKLGLVYARYSGTVTFEEFRDFNVALRADPEFTRDKAGLAEIGGAVIDVSSSEFVKFGHLRDELEPLKQLAVVGPSDVEFGTARMFAQATARSDYPIKAFRDRESALEWLGLKGETLPEV
jgi:SpoIIAA-like